MKIAKVDEEIFSRIYKRHLIRDFPFNEQRPLRDIQRLFKKGLYQAWVVMDGQELLAYASFSSPPNTNVSMLDYFAVVPAYRGQGTGGKFLKELKKRLDFKGFLLECEKPSRGTNQEERVLRERRIDFYLKNGGVVTDVVWQVGNVVYQILWLPFTKERDKINTAKEVKNIYRHTNGWFFNRFFTKILPVTEEKEENEEENS